MDIDNEKAAQVCMKFHWKKVDRHIHVRVFTTTTLNGWLIFSEEEWKTIQSVVDNIRGGDSILKFLPEYVDGLQYYRN